MMPLAAEEISAAKEHPILRTDHRLRWTPAYCYARVVGLHTRSHVGHGGRHLRIRRSRKLARELLILWGATRPPL